MIDPNQFYLTSEMKSEKLKCGKESWAELRKKLEPHIRKFGQREFILGKFVIDAIQNEGETNNVGSNEHIGVV